MRKIKRVTSVLLSALLAFSMTAIAFENVSAAIDENGCYVPEDTQSTYRYYFAMPNTWLNAYTDTAGVYWWAGPDACVGDNDVKWPGYKAQREGYQSNCYGVYYIDCPTNVPTIVWNNYIDGGMDRTSPLYSAAKQARDVSVEFCSVGDLELYSEEWFAEIEEIYNTDKSALGEYADNFFYDEELDCGFSFRYDNMIYVVNHFSGNPTSGASWNDTYEGDWYFYYGNGEYGTYPTREGAEAHGTLYSLSNWKGMTASPDEPAPTEPKPDIIGDVDGNGVLNISDTTMIQLYLADLTVFSPEQITKADVNRDRVVNVFDVTSIQFLLVGRGIGYWC